MSRANVVERALKIDAVIEHLTAAKLAAEDWMDEQEEVPDWLREYVHQTTTAQIPFLEQERVRLDTVLEAMNAGRNAAGRNAAGRNAVGISDSEINTLVERADELSRGSLTRLAKIEFTDKYFQEAAEIGDALTVRLLLADGRIDPTTGNKALRHASTRGHVNVVRLLLADGRIDPTSKSSEALRIASEHGLADIVKLLLADRRVVPTGSAWERAIRFGRVEVVKLFLEDNRMDPSVYMNKFLYFAAKYNKPEIVELLLEDSRILTAGGLEYALSEAENEYIKIMISEAMHRRGGKRQTRNARNRQTRNARNRQTRQTRKRQ